MILNIKYMSRSSRVEKGGMNSPGRGTNIRIFKKLVEMELKDKILFSAKKLKCLIFLIIYVSMNFLKMLYICKDIKLGNNISFQSS